MPDKKDYDSGKERWYYDACTLDKSTGAYAEMFSKTHPIQPILSHLTIGEAYGAASLKGDEPLGAFNVLMNALRSYFYIVENDNCNAVLEEVRGAFPALSVTDSLHLATAIQHRCVVMRTTDRDLFGLNKDKLHGLGKAHGLDRFSVNEMKFKS